MRAGATVSPARSNDWTPSSSSPGGRPSGALWLLDVVARDQSSRSAVRARNARLGEPYMVVVVVLEVAAHRPAARPRFGRWPIAIRNMTLLPAARGEK